MLRPLRAALLCSRRCPGIEALLADQARGRRWEIAGVLTTEEELPVRPLLESAGVPVASHPIRAFYRRRGRPLSDFTVRAEYDEETARLLSPWRPDVLLLSSYLYLVTPALLDAFGGRVVNIHGSDLTRRGPNGRPRYLGLRAVRGAILAGERGIRATAHWVTEELDAGPPILRSRPFPVSPLVRDALARGDLASLKAYAFAHQEWMLREAWGPLWRAVLRLVASGRAVPEPRCVPVLEEENLGPRQFAAPAAGMRP